MTESLSTIPSGISYYLGGEARLRRTVEETAMSVFANWSYEEIITPTVDYYSLFECGMGSFEAQHAFRFTDTDGRLLALRPDVTSGIARAAATLLAKRPRPLRLCYAAPVFRQRAQSRSEWSRESTQIGCELMGQNTTAADLEVLAIVVEILQRLGLNQSFVITLNNLEIFNGIAENLALNPGARDELRRLIDVRDVTEVKRFLGSYASAEECQAFSQIIKLSGKQEIFDKARRVITNARSRNALDGLERLWRIVESLNLAERFEIDLGDVSRLDYYTGLTIKIYVDGLGVQVGSGGRYDSLIGKFGKPEPAVGFVLRLDVLAELLKRSGESVAARESEATVLNVMDSNTSEIFREAIERRARGESVKIDAG